jgi:uncharacterized OsmC-like protein
MVAGNIAMALQRVRDVLARRPNAGLHTDEPAIARWEHGVRVVTRHANGTQIATDMPLELGGAGDQVTPGWLLRAGLASCLATRIAMEACSAGISLSRLEVLARSTSDARGLLGMTDDDGEQVTAAPRDVQLEVNVGSPDCSREQLEAMIKECCRCSPVSAAIETMIPIGLRIDIEPS